MQLAAIVEALSLHSHGDYQGDAEINWGYCSDLLSDVMGKATARSIWVTNQVHANVVAVASLIDAVAVVIAGGVSPEQGTLEKAKDMDIPIFTTDLPAFEVVGRLYELGVRGGVRGG